jgi:hypothetical protein
MYLVAPGSSSISGPFTFTSICCVKQQRQPALGEEGDFAVHASVYGKVQAEPDVTPNDQERRRKGGRCFLLARARLSSYLSRLCIMCVHLSVPGGGIHPTTVFGLLTGVGMRLYLLNSPPSLLFKSDLSA